MKEPTMPVQIFLDGNQVFNGQLLQNGAGLALSSETSSRDFLHFAAATILVEAKIPMSITRDDKTIGDGEFYLSGEYYCLCPSDQTLQLMDPEGIAQLFIEKHGQLAKLELKTGH